MKKKIPIGMALLPMIFTVGLMANQLIMFKSFNPQAPLLFGIVFSACMGYCYGWKWKDMENGMFHIIIISLPTIALLLLIGILIGSWIMSGTVPALIFYGIKIISAKYFLISGFLLCSILSMALGTSWGAIGTIGLVVVGIGETLGFPLYLSTAAVVCGSFFGDKMSPISDTTNLAPTLTGTKVYDHIKNMVPTTLTAMAITMVAFLLIGFHYEGEAIGNEHIKSLTDTVQQNFHVNFTALIPPVIFICFALLGFPAIPTMFSGIISAMTIAYFVQGNSIKSMFVMITSGFSIQSGNTFVDNILTRGGLSSMTDTIGIVFLALTFGGILETLGCMDSLLRFLQKRLKKIWHLQTSVIGGTFLLIAGTGDSYLPMALIGRIFCKAYDNLKYSRLNLSRAIEEGGTLLSPLVPWSASGIFISTTLGLGIAQGNTENLLYIPFSFLCWLSPLLGIIFSLLGIFSPKATAKEIKSYANADETSNHISQPFQAFLKWYDPPRNVFIATPQIARDNRIEDIVIPGEDIFEHGDTGYGICNGNPLIIIQKEIYEVKDAFKIEKILPNIEINSANLTFFSGDISEKIEQAGGQDIHHLILSALPSLNMVYAFKIQCRFGDLTLTDAKSDSHSSFTDKEGTVIGFHYPEFLKNIASGLELYFLDIKTKTGGKIKEGETLSMFAEIQQIPRIHAGLPLTVDFLTADLKENK